MAKVKYRYNPETLNYDVITVTAKERLIKWGIMVAASVVVSLIYFAVYSYFYDTPKELTLNNKLSDIKFNYQMLMQELSHIDHLLSDVQKRDDDIYRVVLESDPIPASMRQAGFGGANRYQSLEGYINSSMMIAANRHTDRIIKQLYVQSLSYDELIFKVLNREQMNQSRPALLPVSIRQIRNIYGFGWRSRHPVHGDSRMHWGIDFSAVTGTEIFATGDGTVVSTGWGGGFGNRVIIDHGFGYRTLYAHMHRISVVEGSEVKRGDIIGTVGNTGTSTAPHLHYEVLKNGRNINPIFYFYYDLSPDEYVQLLEQSQNDNFFEEEW